MVGLVKHYRNSMKGIPQLTNNWGSMIKLLDAVLITGFNHVPVLSSSKSGATAITATINLGSNHGFIDRQVVRIAGSTNGWDGDYKVLSADTSSITIECTTEHPTVISGTAACFTAPADFEIVHQTPSDSTEPKRAYRSTNPESIGLILLVHDFCVSGASATGAKFAKVGVVSDMSDIDTITGQQMPSDPNNFGWNGTHHGRAKWYYATPEYYDSYEQRNDTFSPGNRSREFSLVSDSISIFLSIRESWISSLYGVAEFFDIKLQGKNLLLAAAGVNTAMAQSANVYAITRSGLNAGFGQSYIYGEPNQKGLLWYSANALRQDTTLCRPLALGFLTENRNVASSSSSDFYLQNPIIDDSYIFRGVMPFVRLQMGHGRNGIYYTEDGIVDSVSFYNSGGYGNNNYGLSLEAL